MAFPVLRAGDGERLSRGAPSRLDVYGSVASLLGHAARGRGLVLLVDDIHWADEDSLALLEAVLEANVPAVLVLATMRDDVAESPATRWVAARPELTVAAVPPLAPEDVSTVLARAAEAAGARIPASDLAALVEACAGRPFLAEVVGRAVAWGEGASQDPRAQGATDHLAAFVGRHAARRPALCAALLAADGFVEVATLARVLGDTVGDVNDALASLADEGFVRFANAEGVPAADFYHDAIRQAAAQLSGRSSPGSRIFSTTVHRPPEASESRSR